MELAVQLGREIDGFNLGSKIPVEGLTYSVGTVGLPTVASPVVFLLFLIFRIFIGRKFLNVFLLEGGEERTLVFGV